MLLVSNKEQSQTSSCQAFGVRYSGGAKRQNEKKKKKKKALLVKQRRTGNYQETEIEMYLQTNE